MILSELLNLQTVKNLGKTKEEILIELKSIKEISTNQDKLFFNFNYNTQIFIFSHLKNSCKNLTLENLAKEFGFDIKQILRMKMLENNNSFLVVLNSSIAIRENHQKIISAKNVNFKVLKF